MWWLTGNEFPFPIFSKPKEPFGERMCPELYQNHSPRSVDDLLCVNHNRNSKEKVFCSLMDVLAGSSLLEHLAPWSLWSLLMSSRKNRSTAYKTGKVYYRWPEMLSSFRVHNDQKDHVPIKTSRQILYHFLKFLE